MQTVGLMCGGTPGVAAVEMVILRTCAQTRHECRVVRITKPDDVGACDRVVLAPAGTLEAARRELGAGMGDALTRHFQAGKPCLGISAGMLMMFDGGLGWMPGGCVALPSMIQPLTGAPAKVPHMGWNRLMLEPGCHPVVAASGRSGTWMYFNHEEQAEPAERADISATTEHGTASIAAAVHRGNAVGTLFRPERSHRAGIRLIVAFLDQG